MISYFCNYQFIFIFNIIKQTLGFMIEERTRPNIKKFISIFTDHTIKTKEYNLNTIRKLFTLVHSDGQTRAQQKFKQLCGYINTFFLLNFLHHNLLVKECYNSPADEKVITVIFLAYEIIYLDEFVKVCKKRETYLKNLINQLLEIKQQLMNHLRVMRISKTDIQNISNTKLLMSFDNQKLRYYSIVSSVYENNRFIEHEIKRLFDVYFLNCHYRMLSSFSSISDKQTTKEKIQSLKLQIMYIRCVTKVDRKRVQAETQRSKIYRVFQFEGFETLLRYFNNLSLKDVQKDKQYCQKFFFSQMTSIPEEKQQSIQSQSYQMRKNSPPSKKQ